MRKCIFVVLSLIFFSTTVILLFSNIRGHHVSFPHQAFVLGLDYNFRLVNDSQVRCHSSSECGRFYWKTIRNPKVDWVAIQSSKITLNSAQEIINELIDSIWLPE